MPYLLDTGILLRLFDRNDSQHASIRVAIKRLARRGERLVTASQNIAEFWNVSTRPKSARGGYGHPIGRVQRRVGAIERFCDVITESEDSYVRWKSLIVNHGMVGVAVHDARLVAIMNDHAVDRILTLNPNDFQRFSGIQVETPDQVS